MFKYPRWLASSIILFLSGTAHADPFLWGVANSAYQTEGSPAPSDTNEEMHTKGIVKDGSNADRVIDFWNRYDVDFADAEKLNANAFRISVAWERIEPQRGHFDEAAIAHYEAMILDMRRHKLEPVVTLLHSALPTWVGDQGGVLSPNFPTDFAEYMYQTVKRLSGGPARVKYWLTINEPNCYAEGKYIDSAKTNNYVKIAANFMNALVSQVKAHLAGVQRVQPLALNIKIGIAEDWSAFQTYHKNEYSPLRWEEQSLGYLKSKTYNRFVLDGIINGRSLGFYRFQTQGFRPLDFIGINYYTREVEKFPFDTPHGNGARADNGMEVYPDGIENALMDADDYYHLPLMVTENGLDDGKLVDMTRVQALEAAVRAIDRVRARGVTVLGYLHWSLTDNFEWDSGLSEHYGLMEINFKTLERKPRLSYYAYQKIISEHRRYGL